MRHLNSINQLGRKSADRKAMLANMASSLILHKRISTTTAKARVLRRYVEPLITKSKEDSTHSRRVVFSYLENKNAVSELFREVAPRIADRPGGYTRILKTGNRLGDSADMCIIELVDFNENMLATETKTKSSRRRRSPKKKAEGETAAVAAAPAAAPAAAEDTVTPETSETAPAAGAVTDTETVTDAEIVTDAETVADTDIVSDSATEEKTEDSESEKKE